MADRAAYADDVKAAALAALLAGQSVSAVAREYDIPKGTVSAWKQRRLGPLVVEATGAAHAANCADMGADAATGATQKAPTVARIGDLLLQLVAANLEGMVAAAGLMQDAAWLRQQDAASLGTFLGITHDKTMRMLEALDRSAEPAEPPGA